MPAFDLVIQGKTYHVEISDPGATPLSVIVDGQPFEVGIIGTQIEATATIPVLQPPPSASAPTELPRRPSVPVARPAVPVSGNGGDEIRAPMPGTILSIETAVGQGVDNGQVLCMLEAMKMKNPIRAPRAGTVAAIAVQVGQTVAYGDLLVTLA